jgi:hypothetical protein
MVPLAMRNGTGSLFSGVNAFPSGMTAAAASSSASGTISTRPAAATPGTRRTSSPMRRYASTTRAASA